MDFYKCCDKKTMKQHITFGDMADALQRLRDKYGYNYGPDEQIILEEAIRIKENK